MTTHSRGAWRVTVHGVTKSLDMIQPLKTKKKNLSENPSIFSKEQQTISNIYVKGKGLKQSKQFFFKEDQSWRTPVT